MNCLRTGRNVVAIEYRDVRDAGRAPHERLAALYAEAFKHMALHEISSGGSA